MNLVLPKNQNKPQEKVEKPYKEDFFSNFESYHVAEDYAEDIIAYLKERDVLFTIILILIFIVLNENQKLSPQTQH